MTSEEYMEISIKKEYERHLENIRLYLENEVKRRMSVDDVIRFLLLIHDDFSGKAVGVDI